MFTSEFFTHNRKQLIAATKAETIVISANGLLQRSADTTYPFRQDSSFWYLTGLHEPELLLVIDAGEESIVLPRRDSSRDLWEGALDITALKKVSGIERIIDFENYEQLLKKRISKNNKVHTTAPAEAYIDAHGFYTNPARAASAEFLKLLGADLLDCRQELARLRQRKQDPELKALNKAISITVDAFADIKTNLKHFKTEKDIEAEFSAYFAMKQTNGHAYTPIVGCGKHATTLHYIKNDSSLIDNSLVLLDIGAEYEGYAADITRTWAHGTVSAKAQTVHKLVQEVQAYAMDQLKPHVLLREYEKAVQDYLQKRLVELKIVSSFKDARKACPHAMSHFIGLDVHDAGDYEHPLEQGMVLTVEPGIYLPEEGIGVRIEDDVLITEEGIENLSARLPSGL